MLAGGWWTRPSNWVANTVVASLGIAAVTYVVWNFSASLEVCRFLSVSLPHFPLLHRNEWFNQTGQYLPWWHVPFSRTVNAILICRISGQKNIGTRRGISRPMLKVSIPNTPPWIRGSVFGKFLQFFKIVADVCCRVLCLSMSDSIADVKECAFRLA